jgi:GT2 family glycosyltransferase
MESVPTLSIIIVNYNTREQLRRALKTLGIEHEVIVVDNASRDDSAQMVELEFPHVKLIKNKKNRGFGPGANQGIDVMTGELAMLMNADCRPRADSVRRLVEAFGEAPDAVAVGPRLVFPGGATQQSAANRLSLWAVLCEQTGLEKVFPWARPLSPYWETTRLMNSTGNVHEVDQVMGACILFKPLLKFDEDYFLYCEDTDFCHRLGKLGLIYWIKDAVFEHDLGASSRLFRWETIARYNRGKELFFEKHYGKAAKALCIFINRCGAGSRLIVWFLLTLLSFGAWKAAWDKCGQWWKVLFVPRVGPPLPRDAM